MTRVGILGAGQLGQMLGEAAGPLGVECEFLDPADSPPAASVGVVRQHAFDDGNALAALAAGCDILTYEFENVPVDALRALNGNTPIYPPLDALAEAQDRLREKRLFDALGIPLPLYHAVDSEGDLRDAIAKLGLPLVLKTRRFGYDGKGQYVLYAAEDSADALDRLPNQPLIAEQWVTFDREVSAIGARRANGESVCYPLTENTHRDGILRTSRAPAGDAGLTELANDYLARLMERLDYVGTLALELFVVGDALLANEFAPRVHNSGHWTIEGARTSQFENHLRAILGLPLGSAEPVGAAGMVNLIGSMPTDAAALTASGACLHDYGKAPRSGRKLGHVTVVADDPAERDRRLQLLDAMLTT